MSQNFFQDIKPIRKDKAIQPKPLVKKQEIVKEIKQETKPELRVENKQVTREPQSEKVEFIKASPTQKSFLKSEPKVLNQNLVYEEELASETKENTGSKYTLWMVAIISIIFLLFAISSLFTRARITINPKIQEVVLNQAFSASKEASNDRILPFSFISLSQEMESTIPSGEEKDYEEKATGRVIIYNNFSTSPQNLLIDTRLEGTNGKLYKTKKPVIIPGIKDGKPGSVEVEVYASESGEEYNTSPIDFKIFGFKGTSKYDKFYGRSKGDISGGIKGKLRLAREEDKNKALDDLKISLEDKLFVKALEQLPEGYILFKGATVFKIADETLSKADNDGNITLKAKGTLYGFLFEENKLTQEIVKSVISKYDGSSVSIPDIKDLSFTLTNPTETFSLSDTKEISFKLNGTSNIIWNVDENTIKENLLDKPKKDFKNILSQYQNIESADLVLRPIWRRTMPTELEDIKIIIPEFKK